MSWMRPRGESASSPSTRYVGQSFRQSPHEMHVARSSWRTCAGATELAEEVMKLGYGRMTALTTTRRQRLPDVVVVPRTTEHVAAVVRFADATGTPVIARGAGTGQTGGAVAANG